MQSFEEVTRLLRRANRRNYLLLTGCCFFSVLLITAYVTMMRAPTVLTVLPEGGDSRKQVMMIFVLAVLGCGVFSCYAAGLFFRSKARDTGLMLALGASRRQLRRDLRRELALIAFGACGAGAVLGAPTAFALWQLFRMLLVDTQEMSLIFDATAYLFALAFALFVFLALQVMGARFIRRTNIMEIVNESRRTEAFRKVPWWYGPAGLGLVVLGGLAGYLMPILCIRGLHWYPPDALSAVFYLPVPVGLYLALLHTVVNGWRGGRSVYRHIIATSMMKFQGRQTVRNMLVITVLLAGAYFASFYTPMIGTGAMMAYARRPVDYAFHTRADQDTPDKTDIETLAAQHGVILTSWAQAQAAVLAVDGEETVETEGVMGTTYTSVYQPVLASDPFLSERAYRELTGRELDVLPGTIASVFTDDLDGAGRMDDEVSRVTNLVTGETLEVRPADTRLGYDLLFGYRVLDDGDYAHITAGLTDEWMEEQVFFNVADAAGSYAFAKALFYEIVDRSGPEAEVFDAWDPVVKARLEARGETYYFDSEHLEENGFPRISYQERDSSAFRMYWKYMPQFRVLDEADFVKTTAVFLMLFVFIALICFAAVLVIGYTRCVQLALMNAGVYEDLRRLGAGRAYLYHAVQGQTSRVWFAPCALGTAVIYAFYAMIMYMNDGRFTGDELMGMAVCAVLLAVLSTVLYGFYRMTLRKVCRLLQV